MRRWWRWCNGRVAVTIICWVMSIFFFKICPPKRAWKTAFYRNIWNAAAGQQRPWRHWKLLGMKLLINYFKEVCVAPETMLPTQSSRQISKAETSVIFGILAKKEPYENCLESLIFGNGWKWLILCNIRRWWRWCNGKMAVTIICRVMSIFIFKICPPNWAWKTTFYRNIWNAAAGQRRPWRH